MTTSAHYHFERTEREQKIREIGEGTVIYSTIRYDEKRQRNFLYEITDNAILIVKATDRDCIITKMIARPSRIKKYWNEAPKSLILLAVEHTREKLYF